MENILRTAQYTMCTLIIIPLAPFCFLPVWQDIKSSPARLLLKTAAALVCMELLMFFIYFLFPTTATDNLNMLLCTGIFFYLYQREFALERLHLWFIFMTACLIGSFSFLFYHLADIFLHPAAVIEEPVNPDSFLLQLVFEILLILALAYPVRKYLGWLVHHFHVEKVWKIIWLLPFGFTVFALTFIPYDNSVMQTGRFLKVYIITCAVLSILILFIYVLFYKIAYSFAETQKMIQKTANLEIQAQQYHRLLTYMQETSRLRHDFRYQLTVLAEMLKKRNYRELEDYLNQYIATVSDMPVRYCASSAVNAILNHYFSLCQALDIQALFHIRLQDRFYIEEIDLCVLLGNLLENAIDGCKFLEEEKRQITLKTRQTAERVIVLQISNPYQDAPAVKGERFFSTKHEGEGQGLKSVRLIAEKYNGCTDIRFDNDVFEVKVLLNS